MLLPIAQPTWPSDSQADLRAKRDAKKCVLDKQKCGVLGKIAELRSLLKNVEKTPQNVEGSHLCVIFCQGFRFTTEPIGKMSWTTQSQ